MATNPLPLEQPRPRRDPREGVHLAAQDVTGLRFVGANCSVLQGQLAEGCYPGRSEAVVSRRVHRWLDHRLVGAERFLGMGCNVIWLTERGARALEGGDHAAPADLFPRTRPIPLKDLVHHLTVVDLVVLAGRGVPFDAAATRTAWQLQRDLVPAPAAVPDLLLLAERRGALAPVLAFEVDLATESLTKVFLPKLDVLATLLRSWADGGPVGVTVLTRGAGRAAAIQRGVERLPVPVLVAQLPQASGRASIAALAEALSGGD